MAEYVYRRAAPLMTPELSERDAERFWKRVDKSPGQGPKGDCWLWTGGLMERVSSKTPGYPKGFAVRGKHYRPSHIALALDGKPRPSPEMNALHQCDYPPCVRGGHLRWGTQEENYQEARERQKYGPRHLHPDIVREIRASPERNVDIAKRIGVTQACICNIRKRVTHKHVE